MPGEAFHWMQRIKAVEREYNAIRFGTDRLLATVKSDPTILKIRKNRPGAVKPADIDTASARLEATYIIRVFAEFETAVQHFLRAFRIKKPGTTKALIDRVSARGSIPQQPYADAVHRVREYRNSLVHDWSETIVSLSIREAASHSCTFLSRVEGIW